MAKYYTDFAEYTLNEFPGDWNLEWGNFPITVQEDLEATGQRKLVYENPPTSSAIRGASWQRIGVIADVEILTRFWISGPWKGSMFGGCFVRGSGASTAEACGYQLCQIRDSEGFYWFRIYKYVNGAPVVLASYDTGTWNYDAWNWMRFRVVGTSLRAKYWKDGDPEPSTWRFDITDSDYTEGWSGIALSSSYSDQSPAWDIFSVGTNGDVAEPIPAESIQGTVVLEGNPIQNAIITAVRHDTLATYSTISSEQGTYGLIVPSGTYHVSCRYEDPSTGDKYQALSYPYIEVP